MSQTIEEWYRSIPMYTRVIGLSMFITTLAYTLGILNIFWILFDADKIIKLQLWRLITDFLFIGKFSFNFIIEIMMLSNFGAKLENNEIFTAASAGDGAYLFFLLYQMIVILLVGVITSFPRGSAMNGHALIFSIIYYWSRREPYEQLSMYGFRIPGSSLPFALLLFDLVLGAGVWNDIVGIIAGHSYYFLFEVVPEHYHVNRDFKCPEVINTVHRYFKMGVTSLSNTDSYSATGQGFYVRPAANNGNGAGGRRDTDYNEDDVPNMRRRGTGAAGNAAVFGGEGNRLGGG